MKRGFALVGIVIVIAIVAGGAWFAVPKWFPGESKRAAMAARTTEQLLATTDHQGAVVAASIVEIAKANAETAPSPQKSFIAEESGLALTLLPRADATALIESERRKTAFLEGRLTEARSLYETASKSNAQLQRERDAVIAAKRASDEALQEAAAASHVKNMQIVMLAGIAALAFAAWIWFRIHSIGPGSLGKILHDLKAGIDPTTAFDEATNHRPALQRAIAKARKLAAP